MRLAPSYQGIFYISYKIVVKTWHGKHLNLFEIPVTVTATDLNAQAPQLRPVNGLMRWGSVGEVQMNDMMNSLYNI